MHELNHKGTFSVIWCAAYVTRG